MAGGLSAAVAAQNQVLVQTASCLFQSACGTRTKWNRGGRSTVDAVDDQFLSTLSLTLVTMARLSLSLARRGSHRRLHQTASTFGKTALSALHWRFFFSPALSASVPVLTFKALHDSLNALIPERGSLAVTLCWDDCCGAASWVRSYCRVLSRAFVVICSHHRLRHSVT